MGYYSDLHLKAMECSDSASECMDALDQIDTQARKIESNLYRVFTAYSGGYCWDYTKHRPQLFTYETASLLAQNIARGYMGLRHAVYIVDCNGNNAAVIPARIQ